MNWSTTPPAWPPSSGSSSLPCVSPFHPTAYALASSPLKPVVLACNPDSQANANATGHVQLLHNPKPWFGPKLLAVGGATEVAHVGNQVMGMFDDGKQFAVVPVPGTYGCPQAGKGNFILGTSAEVAGLTFDSTNKRVLTADGRAIPTPRDERQVCSTQAIVIPPGYHPASVLHLWTKHTTPGWRSIQAGCATNNWNRMLRRITTP